jgi:lipopolysaccharide/colanic/teichoic acid biosynthesis glycosyltransferase
MKRLLDIFLSLIAITVFLIPMIIISLLLVLIEKHQVLFRQTRVGYKKSKFNILKFQTMIDGVPTKTGKVLRKTGLDELPQFINVLKGDMSIVGPRALTEYDIQRLGWDEKKYSIRWELKPGITGFSQIYGGQHKRTSWFFDMYYVKNRNLCVDFAIILVSFAMNIVGKTRTRRFIFNNEKLR